MLFLSRLDTKKGLDLLLQAFARVRGAGQNPALVVAGTGDAAFEAGLRREAARLGIDGDLHWAGFLSGADKLAALADADLFVLPSYSENFGISVVEAMAAGLPGAHFRPGGDSPGGDWGRMRASWFRPRSKRWRLGCGASALTQDSARCWATGGAAWSAIAFRWNG